MPAQSRIRSERRSVAWKPLLEARRDEIMRMPGVIGVGIGGYDGAEHVVVTVRPGSDAEAIRAALAGLRVEIKKSGPYRLY
ncbi:hypothetical protein [Oleisolibacter albus]|uniref:hypothetical protein n=1 Tax=Oleisolibacter albus TaxID=2171757 RepID=UPI0012D807A2|nr:hypothetical protein [Oleisolibacter albus]